MAKLADQLRATLAPVVTDAGLFLEDVDVSGPARKRLVRVVVDLPDGPGGVGSDQLGEVSHAVSEALDAVDDALEGAYLLEVTTPGVSRPLTEARHFRRAQGRLVTVETAAGAVTGRVRAVTGGQVELLEEPRTGTPVARTVALADVRSARVEVELRRSATDEAEGEG